MFKIWRKKWFKTWLKHAKPHFFLNLLIHESNCYIKILLIQSSFDKNFHQNQAKDNEIATLN
jgi:hypothetical protein